MSILRAVFVIFFLAFTANAEDTLVVLNKEGASAWLLDPVSGDARARIEVGEGPHEAAVSPDGRIAVVANYGGQTDGSTLSVIDVAGGALVRTISLAPHRRPHGIVYHPDGDRVFVTAEQSNAVLEVHVERAEITAVHDAGGDVHMVSFDKAAQALYATAIGRGQLSEIHPGNAPALRTLDTGAGTEALALRPNSNEVWVGSNQLQELRVVDRDSWEVTEIIDCGLQPIRLAFTNDGRHALASCLLSGDLAVIDAGSRTIDRRIPLGDFVLKDEDWRGKSADEIRAFVPQILESGARPIGVLAGPDGRFVYVANRGQANIAVIEIESWSIVRRLPTGPGPDGMAYSRIESES